MPLQKRLLAAIAKATKVAIDHNCKGFKSGYGPQKRKSLNATIVNKCRSANAFIFPQLRLLLGIKILPPTHSLK